MVPGAKPGELVAKCVSRTKEAPNPEGGNPNPHPHPHPHPSPTPTPNPTPNPSRNPNPQPGAQPRGRAAVLLPARQAARQGADRPARAAVQVRQGPGRHPGLRSAWLRPARQPPARGGAAASRGARRRQQRHLGDTGKSRARRAPTQGGWRCGARAALSTALSTQSGCTLDAPTVLTRRLRCACGF